MPKKKEKKNKSTLNTQMLGLALGSVAQALAYFFRVDSPKTAWSKHVKTMLFYLESLICKTYFDKEHAYTGDILSTIMSTSEGSIYDTILTPNDRYYVHLDNGQIMEGWYNAYPEEGIFGFVLDSTWLSSGFGYAYLGEGSKEKERWLKKTYDRNVFRVLAFSPIVCPIPGGPYEEQN